MSAYKPGDPPPKGYINHHVWAAAQKRGGLKQKRCPICYLYNFPQERKEPRPGIFVCHNCEDIFEALDFAVSHESK